MRRQQEFSLPETTKEQEMNLSLEAVRGSGERKVTQCPKAESRSGTVGRSVRCINNGYTRPHNHGGGNKG